MNYLAHILLSGPDEDWQLGGFLGDFIKGPLPSRLVDATGQQWPPGVLQGVRLHRQLDAWIDRHPDYLACLAALGPDCRRLGGVALDVFFDHLLVQYWPQFHPDPLPEFSRQFYRLCEQQQQRLPANAARFMAYAAGHDLFQSYGDAQVYRQVLAGIDRRIRFDTNLLAAGEQALQQQDTLLDYFFRLMPELMQQAERWRAQTSAGL